MNKALPNTKSLLTGEKETHMDVISCELDVLLWENYEGSPNDENKHLVK